MRAKPAGHFGNRFVSPPEKIVVTGVNSKRVASLNRAHPATTFALRDMADSRRFVMTFRYDLAFLEAKTLTISFVYRDWSG
jgi:hypothetical protein